MCYFMLSTKKIDLLVSIFILREDLVGKLFRGHWENERKIGGRNPGEKMSASFKARWFDVHTLL